VLTMARIERNPVAAAENEYDLIVVGGGIYGAALTLESARRGLKPLLLERDDFGGATSWNSLRIVHGGLRYLQQLDLTRMRESIRERRWYRRCFPDLVTPLACLMPLYGRGLRRPSVFRLALGINDWMSRQDHDDGRFLAGRVLDVAETIEYFPAVDRAGLVGGALWYDAVMPSSSRVVIEILRWAAGCGATSLNYVEGRELLLDAERVTGVAAADRETSERRTFRAPVVVNCAGPWSRELAATFGHDAPALFRPALAFNLLLDRAPLSAAALAVAPKRSAARTYFLVPWRGRILAGTYHVPWTGAVESPRPDPRDIARMLDDLNAAVDTLSLTSSDVLQVHAGLLPAANEKDGTVAARPKIVEHGPDGLFSVAGVKFTTARSVAEQTLKRIFANRLTEPPSPPPMQDRHASLNALSGALDTKSHDDDLRRLAEDEAVVHLDDLFLRRGDWVDCHEQVRRAAPSVCVALGWDAARTALEIDRLDRALDAHAGVVSDTVPADVKAGHA